MTVDRKDTMKEKRDEKYRAMARQRNLSIFLLAAAVVLVLVFFRDRFSEPIYIEAQERVLYVKSSSGLELNVPYEDITSVTLTDAWDYGTLVCGSETGSARAGVWANEEAGDYALFALKKAEHVLVLTTDGDGLSVSGTKEETPAVHTVVFSYESDETTDGIYNALPELLEQKSPDREVAFTSALSREEDQK